MPESQQIHNMSQESILNIQDIQLTGHHLIPEKAGSDSFDDKEFKRFVTPSFNKNEPRRHTSIKRSKRYSLSSGDQAEEINEFDVGFSPSEKKHDS
jgi:hypothetical protein